MVWFNVDDTLAFHQKTIRAGNGAMGLWVRAGSWCAQTLSNGFVPTAIARSLGTPGQAQKLCDSGLWQKLSTGYVFHEWELRNRTKSDIESEREANRVRKAEQRKRKNVSPGQSPDVTEPKAPASQGVSQVASPAMSQGVSGPPYQSIPNQAIPSTSSGHLGEGSPVGDRASRNDPPPPRCPKHINDPTDAPCRACGDARRGLDEWNRRSAEAANEAKLNRRAVIDECRWCDRNGIREEPAEIRDYDVPAVKCDHTPMSIEDWRELIPEEANIDA